MLISLELLLHLHYLLCSDLMFSFSSLTRRSRRKTINNFYSQLHLIIRIETRTNQRIERRIRCLLWESIHRRQSVILSYFLVGLWKEKRVWKMKKFQFVFVFARMGQSMKTHFTWWGIEAKHQLKWNEWIWIAVCSVTVFFFWPRIGLLLVSSIGLMNMLGKLKRMRRKKLERALKNNEYAQVHT